MSNLFDKIDNFKKALDYSWKRNEIISNNIANADTPQYKAKDIDFEKFMSQAENNTFELITTEPQHIKEVSNDTYNEFIYNQNNPMRLDGNTVDVEQEMGNMIKNSLYFDGLSMQLSRSLNSLRNAITEGGRK
ncbi:flagellar basal body rod protein FlgB [Caldicellulosiruptoraceae bacterium PP1]